MTNTQIRILKIFSIIFTSLSTCFLLFLFLQNNYSTPLILHYIYDFGDFLGNKINLIYIVFGIWSILILNLYLSKIIHTNFKSLSDLLNITNVVISFFSLLLSLQIFLNNI